MIHEPFFYEDRFFESVEDFLIYLEIDEENIEDANDFYKCYMADLEPIFKLSTDWIIDRIDEERFTEDGDEIKRIEQVLSIIDFNSINESMPKLWYENGRSFELTKADLYEALI